MPTAVTSDPDPAELPVGEGPAALPADPSPAALPVVPPHDAPAVALADPAAGAEPPQVAVVVVVVVVDDEAGDGVGVMGVAGGGGVAAGGVVAGGVVAGGVVAGGAVVGGDVLVVLVVVVVDPADDDVVVVVVVVDGSEAAEGVDVDAPVAAVPADCSPLSAHAIGHCRTSRTQRAAVAPSTATDGLRLIRASPVPERDFCRYDPAVCGRVNGYELQNEPGAAEPGESARRQAQEDVRVWLGDLRLGLVERRDLL